jgi:hypothetical protein
LAQLQPTPQAQVGPQAQVASARGSWQPQMQSDPVQLSQAQRLSLSSIMGISFQVRV